MPNHSNITAAADCDGVFHREYYSGHCDSVSWVIEVSQGYHSVHIYYLRQRGITSVLPRFSKWQGAI